MAGSPKKREREKTARLKAAEQKQEMIDAPGVMPAPVPAPVPYQDVLPPVPAIDVTRTAQKRAMRAKAQEHATKAIEVLQSALDSPDERVRLTAANDLLAWGFGKPAQEIEAGEGAQVIQIIRFGDQ